MHDLVKALGEKEAKLTELTKSTDDLHSERRTMLNSINEKNSRIKLLEGAPGSFSLSLSLALSFSTLTLNTLAFFPSLRMVQRRYAP